jgi:hypothetical protein
MARVPLRTEDLPGKVPTPTPGGASAPPAGGSIGAFADFAAGAPSAALPLHYLSQLAVEALLPDGNKVTLALDRPG